jgi:hypothetical protein
MLMTVAVLVCAASVSAYSVPKPPKAGTPGGPPSTPTTTTSSGSKTGSKTGTTSAAVKAAEKATASAATALGDKFEGYTALELSKLGTITIKVTFPRGGTMLARVTALGTTIGQGYAGRADKGTQPMSLSFSTKGRSLLAKQVGKSVTLTIKLTFSPNVKHGTIVSSSVTLKTLA